jgi:hypothetical protein
VGGLYSIKRMKIPTNVTNQGYGMNGETMSWPVGKSPLQITREYGLDWTSQRLSGYFGLETVLTQNATKVNTNCLLFGSIFCMVLIVEAINYVHCKIKSN